MYHHRMLELRKDFGISQTDIATALNISRGRYSMYELNKRKTPVEVLEGIADYYNVDMDYLLGKTDVRRKISICDLQDGNKESAALEIKNLNSEIDKALFREYKDLDDNEKRLVLCFIKTIKNKEEVK